MPLKPEVSLGVALATATVVYGIYQNATPPLADIRSLESGNTDIQGAERQATWTAAAVVAGISLLAKDPTIFVVGGTAVVVMAWSHRHADTVDVITKRASPVMPKLGDIGSTPSGITTAPEQTTTTINYGTSVI
jgi:hypothetical protein